MLDRIRIEVGSGHTYALYEKMIIKSNWAGGAERRATRRVLLTTTTTGTTNPTPSAIARLATCFESSVVLQPATSISQRIELRLNLNAW